ncbi:aspartate/glutamate racemase family protein [Commensalibacter papalotli (ex Botero et al. 2024)]|uniref:aspartate/glutamate racemase family protein n=1 Tax=Commensalibacter papalotli (ex Botero et al. 2024) TaxID=2972766 RepID=UPI0038D02D02
MNSASKRIFLDIVQDLHKQGAEGIILGCTEIPLLIQQQDSALGDKKYLVDM